MNICLFGGTFDPIHRGHLAVARAAARRCGLQRVEFVVTDVPPHKRRQPIAPFIHRYAMVALALAGEKKFFPSTLEAPDVNAGDPLVHYSIDTVRRVKRGLKTSDRLFFLIGMDAFADIATWHEPQPLLKECEFIVVSRPGYKLADIGRALPGPLQPSPSLLKALRAAPERRALVQSGVTIHLLHGVKVPVSATSIRRAAAQGQPLGRMVPPEVAEYIKKMKLYHEQS